jgi:predicted transcriptional regulator
VESVRVAAIKDASSIARKTLYALLQQELVHKGDPIDNNMGTGVLRRYSVWSITKKGKEFLEKNQEILRLLKEGCGGAR